MAGKGARLRRYRGHTGKVVPWQVSKSTHTRLLDLARQFETTLEGSDEQNDIYEQIQGLPGFPSSYDPERDLVEIEVTSASNLRTN